uniref:Uncharacterized protein n=1 Tax=Anopheles culicifacies TaxID=139723 RepID=A0A182LZ95_9DIPT
MEDNLFTNRSYYNDLSSGGPGMPDADTFGSTTIKDRLNRNPPPHNAGHGWDAEAGEVPDDVNGNECEHYLHSTHNPSSLNLSFDEGQLPASDRSQLPIDAAVTERPDGSQQALQADASDGACGGSTGVA